MIAAVFIYRHNTTHMCKETSTFLIVLQVSLKYDLGLSVNRTTRRTCIQCHAYLSISLARCETDLEAGILLGKFHKFKVQSFEFTGGKFI